MQLPSLEICLSLPAHLGRSFFKVEITATPELNAQRVKRARSAGDLSFLFFSLLTHLNRRVLFKNGDHSEASVARVRSAGDSGANTASLRATCKYQRTTASLRARSKFDDRLCCKRCPRHPPSPQGTRTHIWSKRGIICISGAPRGLLTILSRGRVPVFARVSMAVFAGWLFLWVSPAA